MSQGENHLMSRSNDSLLLSNNIRLAINPCIVSNIRLLSSNCLVCKNLYDPG